MIRTTAAAVTLLALSQLPLPPELPPLPPLPPPPCLVPPCEVLPPLPPIPPDDDPPVFTGKIATTRSGKYVYLDWPGAHDDVLVWGYRLFRDGNIVGRRPASVTSARLLLPCGRHRFRVEVVDSSQQTASLSRRVTRAC